MEETLKTCPNCGTEIKEQSCLGPRVVDGALLIFAGTKNGYQIYARVEGFKCHVCGCFFTKDKNPSFR